MNRESDAARQLLFEQPGFACIASLAIGFHYLEAGLYFQLINNEALFSLQNAFAGGSRDNPVGRATKPNEVPRLGFLRCSRGLGPARQ